MPATMRGAAVRDISRIWAAVMFILILPKGRV
jgi:hypothetical protein